MNILTVRQVLRDPSLKALFGAALLLANEHGTTIKELSDQLGIPKAALRRYTRDAKAERRRDPKAFLVYTAAAAGGCDHRALWGPGLRICLSCLMDNNPGHPGLRRSVWTDPKPEPSKVYRPGKLKGGVA